MSMNKVFGKFIFVSVIGCTFFFIIFLNNHHTIRDIITRNLKLITKHNYTRISKLTNEFAALPSINATNNLPNDTVYRSNNEDVYIANEVGLGQKKFKETMKESLEAFEEKLNKTFKALEENFEKIFDKIDVRYEEKFKLKKNLIDDIIGDTYCENNNLNIPKKTIIIVPYRDRADNLKLFISPIHKHLMDQVMIRNVNQVCNNKNLFFVK